MGRKVMAVVAALLAAWAVFMVCEMIGTRIGGAPDFLASMTREEMVSYFASRPTLSYVTVLIGYLIGSFLGGFIVTKMSRREGASWNLSILVGVILTIGAFLNFFVTLPGQPVWFIFASLICFLPLALIGYRFAR